MLGVPLRARHDTTQVMLGVSLRARWDTTLVYTIVVGNGMTSNIIDVFHSIKPSEAGNYESGLIEIHLLQSKLFDYNEEIYLLNYNSYVNLTLINNM